MALLGRAGADALAGELEDGGVVNQSVDGGHGSHAVSYTHLDVYKRQM